MPGQPYPNIGEYREEFNLLTSRIQSVYEEACRLFYLAQSGYMSRNLSDIRAAEKEFGAVMTDLADAKYRLAGMEEERGRLAQNVDLIEQVASTSIITVTAPVSGVFTTSYWQGFAQLTPENIGQKDASQIISIMNQIVKDGLTEVAAAQEVKQGDYMGMIITGEPVRCYMPVKTEDRPDIIAGQRAWISLPDGSNFDATVNSVVDGIPPGYSVISCDLEPVPTGRVFLAEQTSIINKRHSGILIPVKSLITREDGQQGVLLSAKLMLVSHQ